MSIARFIIIGAVALVAILAPFSARAEGSLPCAHYSGHADFEGSYGSQRHLGETSIFIPVACSEDRLFFSDIKFRGDNQDNREGNIGLGVRQLKETGVLGGYVYVDRKYSGVTEDYHTQITSGAEWLTEDWEVRANAYLPVTGEKTIPTTTTGEAFLTGSGVFARQQNQVIREEGLYGGDIEGGIKLPRTDLWMHGAVFYFKGEHSPSIDGARVRATYEVTDNIALFAEAQYDDERGRQGWIGARFTVPFGGPQEKNDGLKTRMNASPKRDIDIVTQATVAAIGAPIIAPVVNVDTGIAQRIIFVDNTAAGGGTGTKENPYNTLAAAQAALQDHDIVYIAAGDGNTTGMNAGMTVSRNDVKIIGSGVDFVLDTEKFDLGDLTFASNIIARATTAPNITNTGGNGITVTGNRNEISGVTVRNSSAYNVRITNADDTVIHNVALNNGTSGGVLAEFNNSGNYDVTYRDSIGTGNTGTAFQVTNTNSTVRANVTGVTGSNNTSRGIHIQTTGGSTTAIVKNNITNSNNTYGIYINAQSAAVSLNAQIEGNTIIGNKNNNGIYVTSLGTSVVTANVVGNHVSGTIGNGLLYQALDNGNISGTIHDNVFEFNSGNGLYSQTRNNGIANVNIYNNVARNNGNGLTLETVNAGSITASAYDNKLLNNNNTGINMNDTSTGIINADFGGGSQGSIGNNVSSGNSQYDVRVDLDGGQLKAENNYWGSDQGLDPAKTNLLVGSTVDANPFLSTAPDE